MTKPSNARVAYSMGMVFSENYQEVLLIEKNRPDFLRGKWTGVGGHIEPGETPLAAVAREVEEETGLRIAGHDWTAARVHTDETSIIHVFAARADLSQARSMTEEHVAVHAVHELDRLPCGPRLLDYIDEARRALAQENLDLAGHRAENPAPPRRMRSPR